MSTISRAYTSSPAGAANAHRSILHPPMLQPVSHAVRRRAPAASMVAPTAAQSSLDPTFNLRLFIPSKHTFRGPMCVLTQFPSGQIESVDFTRGIAEVFGVHSHAVHHAQEK